ncbi:hypothetical protein [Paraburkholderia diazotrophica]|uniref:hypothetical protein n=1 Tax=Paraburkholderia diazotrophica TaxID=667676 RepID=UPI0015A62CFA|nr:hypothetical protein [Paraburkholderia diazotrophica]
MRIVFEMNMFGVLAVMRATLVFLLEANAVRIIDVSKRAASRTMKVDRPSLWHDNTVVVAPPPKCVFAVLARIAFTHIDLRTERNQLESTRSLVSWNRDAPMPAAFLLEDVKGRPT